ncbi:sodium channel, voltage-gated, type IV, beta b isoform X2 [Anarrhichthys ocellatus]|uniref:sodium channel, voltage-gated, type IV, beta b isoform X2 n=1 Tax=Anarrhichthys ocellatus TaxID=433405 RepID=UPI0012EEAE28|nr:sodium channel subunit beta-4-like isoform X2 [Anarrhichthys ocellatus]
MEVQWFGVELPRLGPPHTAVGLIFSMLLGVWSVQGLEMFAGKIPFLQAVNGSTVMLPCTYASCIGIENLYFNWQFNDNGTMQKVCDSVIVSEGVEPNVAIYRERVEFVGKNRNNNISILLWNITFEDGVRVVDNRLTIIIASAVGGAIAALMGFMLLKNFTIFVLSKIEEKNKECLVTSSGIDNTENGLSGSKADSKPTPKKK